MPVPKPEAGESQDDYIGRCIRFLKHENEGRNEKRSDKQIQAICFSTWRESKRAVGELVHSRPIPIIRAFEHEGKRYIYGYAGLFRVPDDFGTLLTKEVVLNSEQRLRRYPAVRFMHRTPLGQILWDEEVQGVRTFVDDTGFHVLVRVYDGRDDEWNMIQNGGWGFSYGFMPDASGGTEIKCIAENECYPAFVKGFLYEVSVVDSPAHMDAVAHVISRMLNGHKGEIMSVPQDGGTDPAKNRGEKKKLEEAKIEQMFKDAEERITAAVLAKIEKKKTGNSLENSLKELETRVLKAVDGKIAEVSKKPPSEIEKTFTTVQDQVKQMEGKIENLRSIMASLQKAGEDVSVVKVRITQLEDEKKKLEQTIVSSVTTAVQKQIKGVTSRLAALENDPNYASPATSPVKPVQRGFGEGFSGMLNAAFAAGRSD